MTTLSYVGNVDGLMGYLHIKVMQLTGSFLYREDPKKYGLLENMNEAIDDEVFRVRFNDEAPMYPPEAEEAQADSLMEK